MVTPRLNQLAAAPNTILLVTLMGLGSNLQHAFATVMRILVRKLPPLAFPRFSAKSLDLNFYVLLLRQSSPPIQP
jgi:hypothetical protein